MTKEQVQELLENISDIKEEDYKQLSDEMDKTFAVIDNRESKLDNLLARMDTLLEETEETQ
jgi:phage host-nuclease inhibitor protein Gam